MIYQRRSRTNTLRFGYVDCDNFQGFRPDCIWGSAAMVSIGGSKLIIDGIHQTFNNQIVSLSQYHHVQYEQINLPLWKCFGSIQNSIA